MDSTNTPNGTTQAPIEANTPTKKKKKNIFVRFLAGLLKLMLFIVLIIAVSALIFIVFVDNAEAEAFLSSFANGLINDALTAIKGVFA